MSRIGKQPVEIPKGVEVKVADNLVSVKGAKGTLEQSYRPEVTVKVEGEQVIVERCNDSKAARAFHGLYRNLIANMITGVSQGYAKTLLVNGVGYRAEVNGDILMLNLGYSNPIDYMIQDGITINCDGQNKIVISGIDKQKVGQVSAEIRSLRPPEPYKGKGIRYEDEHVRRKIGKSGAV